MSQNRKRNRDRIGLPGGCSISIPLIFPKNWKSPRAKTDSNWYIFFRFYDPSLPTGHPYEKKGFPVFIKGMNEVKDLAKRQALTEQILEKRMDLLKNHAYNPITSSMQDCLPSSEEDLHPNLPLQVALKIAAKRFEGSTSTIEDIRSMMNYVTPALMRAGLEAKPVSQIRKRDIKKLLLTCREIKGAAWSDHQFNKYRSYLMLLFDIIEDWEAIDGNPVKSIKKAVPVKKIRSTLSDEQAAMAEAYVRNRSYPFWRFMHIFFQSGSREIELMRLKGKDVVINSKEQYFKRIVKKRRQATEVKTVITDDVLPLWREIIATCKPDDYIFSRGLEPGPSSIRRDQIGRRWRHIKKALGIEADFYSLKHLFTTKITNLLADQDRALREAAEHNGHTSGDMNKKTYDIEYERRRADRIKTSRISLVPKKTAGNAIPLLLESWKNNCLN